MYKIFDNNLYKLNNCSSFVTGRGYKFLFKSQIIKQQQNMYGEKTQS